MWTLLQILVVNIEGFPDVYVDRFWFQNAFGMYIKEKQSLCTYTNYFAWEIHNYSTQHVNQAIL